MLEVVCGPMFSGKTGELIRQVQHVQRSGGRAVVFRPTIDTRGSNFEMVCSHDKQTTRAVSVASVMDMRRYLVRDGDGEMGPMSLIAVDEGQFFDESLPSFAAQVAAQGQDVLIAGLDLDHLGNGFGPMPELMARADKVTKLVAVCNVCKGVATRSFRMTAGLAQVEVGGAEAYQARCLACWRKG